MKDAWVKLGPGGTIESIYDVERIVRLTEYDGMPFYPVKTDLEARGYRVIVLA